MAICGFIAAFSSLNGTARAAEPTNEAPKVLEVRAVVSCGSQVAFECCNKAMANARAKLNRLALNPGTGCPNGAYEEEAGNSCVRQGLLPKDDVHRSVFSWSVDKTPEVLYIAKGKCTRSN